MPSSQVGLKLMTTLYTLVVISRPDNEAIAGNRGQQANMT